MHSKKTSKIKIAFAGGATGGHVVPIASLIDYIYQHYGSYISDIHWLGSPDSMEHRSYLGLHSKYSSNKDIHLYFYPISSGKIRRKPSISELCQNIWDIYKTIYGIIQSIGYIYTHQIDVIFCKGGYVSLPVTIAGWICGCRIYVHESDTRAGLTTQIASRLANTVWTAFPGVIPKADVLGQILSDDLIPIHINPKTDHKTTILINCGSQGSASIHQTILDIYSQDVKLAQNFKWNIILGSINQNFRDIYMSHSNTIDMNIYDFVDAKQMSQLYIDSDISICRGGTTTLQEQKLFGIHQLIVPLPHTHDQTQNAQYYQDIYGDVNIKQDSDIHKYILYNLTALSHFHKPDIDISAISIYIHIHKKTILDKIVSDFAK